MRADRTVLITRPGARAQALRTALERRGLAPCDLDAMRLERLEVDAERHRQVLERSLDALLCVSPFAVECLAALLTPRPAWFDSVRLFATGESTREAMRDTFGRDALAPHDGSAASEGLLALDELARIAGWRVLLARGEGGRRLLSDTLVARGAKLEELALYRRRLDTPAPPALARLRAGEYLALIVTSAEQLDHLAQWCTCAARERTLIVSSARLATLAEGSGFVRVRRAQDATPEALAQACASFTDD